MKTITSIITTVILVLFMHTATFAQVRSSSVKSGNWSDPSVWNTGTVPHQSDTAFVKGGFTVTIDTVVVNCTNLLIDSNATLNAFNKGTINVFGKWTNSGVFNKNNSTVVFMGAVPQSIGGVTNTVFHNLIINNPQGVFLQSDASLYNELQVQKGVFNSSGNIFTLLSDANNTAKIDPIDSTVADFQGNIHMQRYIHSGKLGWRFYGSPVDSSIVRDLMQGVLGASYNADRLLYIMCRTCVPITLMNNDTYLESYNETIAGTKDTGYATIPASLTSLLKGVGYRCWMDTGNFVLGTTGTPGKFHQSFNLSYTPSSFGPANDGWNLISNPYPSAIDWNSNTWNRSGLDNAVYIWDPVSQQFASYVNGIGVNGGSNIIPSSQGFFVKANQNNPFLSCNEGVKTSNNGSFIRSAGSSAFSNDLVRLSLSGNSFKDETVVYFKSSGTQVFDGTEDAIKLKSLNPLAPGISSVINNTDMTLNCLPSNGTGFDIPVRVKVGVTGTYTIKPQVHFVYDHYTYVVLEDLLTNTKVDLLNDSAYQFTISDTTNLPRFVLHFGFTPRRSSPTGIVGERNAGETTVENKIQKDKITFKIFPNPNNGEFNLDITGMENNHEARICLKDQIGASVYESTLSIWDESNSTVKITPETRLNKGVYYCTITIGGIERAFKVVVI